MPATAESGDQTAERGLKAPASSGASGRTPQQRERRYLWGVAVLTLVLVAAGAGAGVLFGSAERPGAPLSSGDIWLLVAILVAGALFVAAGTAWLLQWRRRRGSRMFARSPLWELPTYRERRALVRALRRGQPIPPEQRDLAARTARDAARRGGLVWLYVGLAVLQMVNFFVQDGSIRWFYLVAAAMFVLAAVAFGWQIRRMRLAAARLEPTA